MVLSFLLAGGCAGRAGQDRGQGGLRRRAGRRDQQARRQGHAPAAHALCQAQGQGQACADGVPRHAQRPPAHGHLAQRRTLHPRPVCRRVRNLDRQGFPGPHEALELWRFAGLPRCLGLPPLARRNRSAPGPWQGLQGQKDGRTPGQRALHRPESPSLQGTLPPKK